MCWIFARRLAELAPPWSIPPPLYIFYEDIEDGDPPGLPSNNCRNCNSRPCPAHRISSRFTTF